MSVPAVPYGSIFAQASARYGVPLPILLAVADQESGFRANAVNWDANGTEDVGIMQLNLQAQGVSYAFAANPALAIPYAARLLANAYRATGSWRAALEVYNSGRPSGDSAYANAVLARAVKYGWTGGGVVTPDMLGALPSMSSVTWVRIGLLILAAIIFLMALSRL